MGVDFITCEGCERNYPDCASFDRGKSPACELCDKQFCPSCAPRYYSYCDHCCTAVKASSDECGACGDGRSRIGICETCIDGEPEEPLPSEDVRHEIAKKAGFDSWEDAEEWYTETFPDRVPKAKPIEVLDEEVKQKKKRKRCVKDESDASDKRQAC